MNNFSLKIFSIVLVIILDSNLICSAAHVYYPCWIPTIGSFSIEDSDGRENFHFFQTLSGLFEPA